MKSLQAQNYLMPAPTALTGGPSGADRAARPRAARRSRRTAPLPGVGGETPPHPPPPPPRLLPASSPRRGGATDRRPPSLPDRDCQLGPRAAASCSFTARWHTARAEPRARPGLRDPSGAAAGARREGGRCLTRRRAGPGRP